MLRKHLFKNIAIKAIFKNVPLQLGITGIFDDKNSAIEGILDNDEPLVVSEARQKAFIEMREEGSEAGAANGKNLSFVNK